MSNKIYVGNLSFHTTEADLRSAFGRHGRVESVNLLEDRSTGHPSSCAYVEMAEPSGAEDAIRALHGTFLEGRTLLVSDAQTPRLHGEAP